MVDVQPIGLVASSVPTMFAPAAVPVSHKSAPFGNRRDCRYTIFGTLSRRPQATALATVPATVPVQ